MTVSREGVFFPKEVVDRRRRDGRVDSGVVLSDKPGRRVRGVDLPNGGEAAVLPVEDAVLGQGRPVASLSRRFESALTTD